MIYWSFYTPLIAYLIDLGEILKDLPLDYLVISETTFNESSQTLNLSSMDMKQWKEEIDTKMNWLIEFVTQGFICKRPKL